MTYSAKLFFIVFSCAATGVAAETLYKSVNEKGQVTFSDSPPQNAAHVQQIDVQPAPTEQQQREAVEREKMIETEANKLGAANAARAQQREQQAPQELPPAVEPVQSYNRGYNQDNTQVQRPIVRPLPGRPVQLPARPAPRPAR